MNPNSDWKKPAVMAGVFFLFFWFPVHSERFASAVLESLYLTRWYAREHVLLCLVPAFFIAGGIGIFVSRAAVMKYLGARARKTVAYAVASVSGSILAVCSCTILPLFAGIWRMGAGLGPACTFLYSGPAINVLAIILTARILGWEMGVARAVAAIAFSVIIGLAMHLVFRKEEMEKAEQQAGLPEPAADRSLAWNAGFFGVMIGVLVFANWGAPNHFRFELRDGRVLEAAIIQAPEENPASEAVYTLKILDGHSEAPEIKIAAQDIVSREPHPGFWTLIWKNKWLLTAAWGVVFAIILVSGFHIAWWKVGLAAVLPAVLGLSLPSEGMWPLLPFSTAVAGLSLILVTQRGEASDWFGATWGFAKQILPLLFFGVLIAGFLLGRPGHDGLIPGQYVEMLVGDNPDTFLAVTGWSGGLFESCARAFWPLWTNLFASVFGAFMYFATLTEVPILQGLMGAGMGKGPALALLLAGPALSLPNMLVIRGVLGTKKTVVFCLLVVIMATISGMIFGALR